MDFYYKLNEKSRLFFFYSATKLDNRETYSDGSLAGYLDFDTLPFARRRGRAQADASPEQTADDPWGIYFCAHSVRQFGPVYRAYADDRSPQAGAAPLFAASERT